MIISLIVAIDQAGGIGKNNRLPWHLSDDLKQFKKLTMGHTMIMGRRTYESIGKALPGRKTIVITRNPEFQPQGSQKASSLEQALEMARVLGETEVFITGGAQVFAEALPLAERLYLTEVDTIAACDVYFPSFDASQWKELECSYHPPDEHNQYGFTFHIYVIN